MVFNSLAFLFFIAIVLAVYPRLRHRGQNLFLLGASYVFYGWWDWRFLGLLVFTSVVDYHLGRWIEDSVDLRKRKLLVTASVAMNMGVLGFFKYYNFFADSLQRVFGAVGWRVDLPTLHVILPLGISFYTFLSLSYIVDVYRGHVKASRNVVDLLLYIAFFPHLVAGPIVRASYLLPQCQASRVVRREEVINGLWLCLLGYVKKMVIADRLAEIADWGFGGAHPPLADANGWLILYAFAFQIYGDFSGYSDIARGVSKLLGFELVLNFGAPYLVTNPSDFWRHWHISLSVWLRDYVYIPLGGNRLGSWKTYRNLMLTMILGGLWHGAGVAYLLWGFYHGALLALHRFLAGAQPGKPAAAAEPRRGAGLFRAAWVILFFHLTCLGWLLFRAGAVRPAGQWELLRAYGRGLINLRLAAGLHPLLAPVCLLGAVALLVQWQHRQMDRFERWSISWQSAAIAAALCLIAGLGVFGGSSFIYFQF